MAEKTTIRELLVALGVKVDSKGLKNFDDALKRTKDNLSGLLSFSLKVAAFGAALGLIANGALKIQTEMQGAKLGIASLYNALLKMPMKTALAVAAEDAKTLSRAAAQGVGDLQNYMDAYSLLIGPGIKGKAKKEDVMEMVKNSISAGFAMNRQYGMKLAPLDVVQAMTRGVDERVTPFATQALRAVDISNEKFNAMSQPERWKALLKGFSSFKESVKEMGKTWSAQSDTLKDNFKALIRTATGPLFEKGTEQLIEWNQWIADNYDMLEDTAELIGTKLVGALQHLNENKYQYIEFGGMLAGLMGIIKFGPAANDLIKSIIKGLAKISVFLGSAMGLTETIAMIAIVIAGAVAQFALLYLVIDDFLTFLRGGESVIGKFFKALDLDKLFNAISPDVLDILNSIWSIFKSIVDILSTPMRLALKELFFLLASVGQIFLKYFKKHLAEETFPKIILAMRILAIILKEIAAVFEKISNFSGKAKDWMFGKFKEAFGPNQTSTSPMVDASGALSPLLAGKVSESIVTSSNYTGSKSIKVDGDVNNIYSSQSMKDLENFFNQRDENKRKQTYSLFAGGAR